LAKAQPIARIAVEDIVVWSKSQLDSFQPDKQIIPIGSIVKNILSIYQPFIEAKEITLVLPDRDLQLCADEHMLQTILRNLIANAIKYTPDKGTISLHYSETPSAISVSNSGNPIDVKIADSLFS
jgi:signal transduction histidine kinase